MPQNNQPNRDALVIAIGKYTDLEPHKLPELVNEAENLAQLLETQGGFRVRRVPVTKSGDKEFIDPEQSIVADELKPIIEEKLMNSSSTTVLLFFTGHGLRQEIKDNHYEGFLATSEASPDEDEWGVSLQWLRELLDKSSIPQQIVWIDACHSGEFIECMKTSKVLDRDRCFITSARAHEEAYADGLLTKALLETLDYSKQLNPWVDHLTLIELLEAKNQTAVGSQRFVFEKTNKPIILTNKAFDLNADYKNICPFKGLQSFDFEKNPDDPHFFKGRTELTNELLEKVGAIDPPLSQSTNASSPLSQRGARGDFNFLAVLGASGNGKSSVVRAGLLYQLRQTQRWQILPVITPTADPLKALGTVIGMPAAQLTDFINQAQTERLVLVIDQFEEVFTLCKNEDEREQFFATLLAAVARADNKFCLVMVMRADFLEKCSQYTDLAKKIEKNQIIVTPMTPAELEEAIVAPTKKVGLQIEPKLVSEMLADVKGALGSLPLLQYTLTELWKTCAEKDRLLTFSAYEKLGKITGTLEKGANGVYAQLSPAEQKNAQRIFIELTQLGEGTPDTRRQLSQQDLVTTLPFDSAPVNQVIHKLVAANLLVTDKPKEEQVAVVNIAHEALTQHWGQLRVWLDGNREAIKVQRNIEADAKKWQDSNKSKNALLQGLDLNIAKDYTKTHTEKVPLSTLAQDFVQRSIKRQRHYWMGVIGSVVGVILVLAGIAYYANEQRIVADEQAKIAQEQQKLADERRIEAEEQRQLAQTQQKLADEQRVEAENQRQFAQKQQQLADERRIEAENQRKLAQEQKQLADERRIEAEEQRQLAQEQQQLAEDESQRAKQEKDNALRSQSLLLADFARQETEKGNATNGILLALEALPKDMSNPDIPYVVEAEERLYNAISNLREYKIIPKDVNLYNINHIKFSPNMQRIIASSEDGKIGIWEVGNGKQVSFLKEHEEKRIYAILSFNGQYIATVLNDGTILLWDSNTGEQMLKLTGLEGHTTYATFSPNGQYIFTYTDNNIAIVWDIKIGKKISILKLEDLKLEEEEKVTSASFSFDGQHLVTISYGLPAILWNIKTGKQLRVLEEPIHSPRIRHVEFSPNGQYLITSHDYSVWIWELNTGKLLFELETGYAISHIKISHDSKYLITVSHFRGTGFDKASSFLWDIKTGKQSIISDSDYEVNYAAFSPNGKQIVTVSDDNVIRLFNFYVYNGLHSEQVAQFSGHYSSIEYVNFSPDSRQIVTVSDDDTIRLWRVNLDEPLLQFQTKFIDPLVAFSLDNQRIIIKGDYRSENITTWNVNTGKELASKPNDYQEFLKIQKQSQKLQNFFEEQNSVYIPNMIQIPSIEYSVPNLDGSRAIICFFKYKAYLWDTHSGKSLGVLDSAGYEYNAPTSAAFSPDGRRIATANDHGVSIWRAFPDTQALIDYANKVVPRRLTPEQRKQFFLE
jgi:WD40 repeat protein/pyruvate/2-oxoglutarate dehydrogenase complex dihydrolipoamide acyltransferase (E2) component